MCDGQLFHLFKDKNSIQFLDNFFIVGQITPRIFENYPAKDRFVSKKWISVKDIIDENTFFR